MPGVQSGDTILVTGANGYIAFWIVRYLLEKGYKVRGTVRSADKGAYLKKIFKDYAERLELSYVADITATGAFDRSVHGVDAILHTASPFHFKAEAPSDFIIPAVKGTTGILESALRYSGSKLKRIVILSSVASVINSTDLGELDDSSWNKESILDVERNGKAANKGHMYCASKTLAEQAGWDFIDKHRSEIYWDLVTLCPPLVFGPVLHDVSSPNTLNTSAKMFYDYVLKGEAVQTPPAPFWIDVRDVAVAHVRAIEHQRNGSERFIISSGAFTYQEFIDEAKALESSDINLGILLSDQHDIDNSAVINVSLNTEKSKSVLGMEYKDKRTTLVDTVNDFKAKGWL